jgi:hypothetical protein
MVLQSSWRREESTTIAMNTMQRDCFFQWKTCPWWSSSHHVAMCELCCCSRIEKEWFIILHRCAQIGWVGWSPLKNVWRFNLQHIHLHSRWPEVFDYVALAQTPHACFSFADGHLSHCA